MILVGLKLVGLVRLIWGVIVFRPHPDDKRVAGRGERTAAGAPGGAAGRSPCPCWRWRQLVTRHRVALAVIRAKQGQLAVIAESDDLGTAQPPIRAGGEADGENDGNTQ
jgi:hypothetical protein